MKSLVIALFLLVGLTSSAAAQKREHLSELPGFNGPSPLIVEELTRKMANSLHLNEAQYIRLRNTNEAKLIRLDEISWQYKDNEAEYQAKIGELEAQYEIECSRILTPSQLSLFHTEQQRDATPTKAEPQEGGLG